MEHRSTLIRTVEIPSTLPSMDTLTDLRGSLILKEVTPNDNALQVEGDLLWRGYFEEGGGECLWEGAEYFSETLRGDDLRSTELPMIEPEILSLTGEALSDSTYRLKFDIRWYETETKEEPTKTAEKEQRAEVKQEEPTPQKKEEPAQHTCGCHREEPPAEAKTDLEEKLERIDETWRETLKAINEPIKETTAKATAAPKEETRPAEAEEDEEVEIKCCPYSKFCLRYYRTQDGDELERIAEKFSATVAKLKEFNKLDDPNLSAGRMLRIP